MSDDFRSPYEIEDTSNDGNGQVDSLVDNDAGSITMGNGGKKPSRKKTSKFWSRGLTLRPASRQQKIVGSAIAFSILVMGSAGIYALSQEFKTPPPEPQPVVQRKPKTSEASKLTGLDVEIGTNQKRVIGIMIENSPGARPQAGLRESGVVFEAIAEGGITRFLTLFLEQNPDSIGPVRSVRPYYAEWAAGFDAALAHAGGSHEGIVKMEKLRMTDLDYTKAVNSYKRASDRFAPHNLYAHMGALRKDMKRLNKKNARPSKFTGFTRKKEPQETPKPTAPAISFSISGSLYDTRYEYDPEGNNYKRFLAGQAHKDHKSGKQIRPKVVVALITKYSQKGIYSVYRTSGSGKIVVFQDGKAYKGTWKKKGPKASLQFFDTAGQPLRLNPGQTWITALRAANEVRY